MWKDNDIQLALQLQAQFDDEMVQEIAEDELPSSRSSPRQTAETPDLGAASGSAAGRARAKVGRGAAGAAAAKSPVMSIVDERWELLDPSPDMRAMFLEFNDKYFWGRLAGVEVRWSPRMTLCAGLCCYEGHGGLCSIRLSSPLLKLRPRKDLVETLLHEMIHAYLFVTANNKDHDGHGPEFCKHMNRLNQSTGTNITIYHNFHDEVDVYRQHWWRCDGPCQKRPPYYGMVRRAMNRAPSRRDPWWAEHQRSCGGSYTKVKEPEGYGAKKGTKRKKEEESGDVSENESKKRATDATSAFPGRGFSIGGSSTTSRLIQPKNTTLDKFFRKTGSSSQPSSSSSSSTFTTSGSSSSTSAPSVQSKHEGTLPEKKSSRMRALAAIFDSDDEEEEDIVIVESEKPLKASTRSDGAEDSWGATKTGRVSRPERTAGTSPSRRSSPPWTAAKPKRGVTSDAPSRRKGAAPSVSGGGGQDSIVEVFSRMRRRSEESKAAEANRKDRGIGADTPARSGGSAPQSSGSPGAESRASASDASEVDCPVCGVRVKQSQINQHLDECLA